MHNVLVGVPLQDAPHLKGHSNPHGTIAAYLAQLDPVRIGLRQYTPRDRLRKLTWLKLKPDMHSTDCCLQDLPWMDQRAAAGIDRLYQNLPRAPRQILWLRMGIIVQRGISGIDL